jgi:hypothetical protein
MDIRNSVVWTGKVPENFREKTEEKDTENNEDKIEQINEYNAEGKILN